MNLIKVRYRTTKPPFSLLDDYGRLKTVTPVQCDKILYYHPEIFKDSHRRLVATIVLVEGVKLYFYNSPLPVTFLQQF